MDFNYEKSLHNVIFQKSHLIDELYDVNCKIMELKQDIDVKEATELLNFNFKTEYGKDNEDIRKSHLTLKFQELHEKLENLKNTEKARKNELSLANSRIQAYIAGLQFISNNDDGV